METDSNESRTTLSKPRLPLSLTVVIGVGWGQEKREERRELGSWELDAQYISNLSVEVQYVLSLISDENNGQAISFLNSVIWVLTSTSETNFGRFDLIPSIKLNTRFPSLIALISHIVTSNAAGPRRLRSLRWAGDFSQDFWFFVGLFKLRKLLRIFAHPHFTAAVLVLSELAAQRPIYSFNICCLDLRNLRIGTLDPPFQDLQGGRVEAQSGSQHFSLTHPHLFFKLSFLFCLYSRICFIASNCWSNISSLSFRSPRRKWSLRRSFNPAFWSPA